MISKSEKKILIDELHKPARRNFSRRQVDIRGIDECWQADLIDMQKYSRDNKGYRYLITVIDNLSKFVWAVGIPNKTGETLMKAMKSILLQGRVPQNLQVDQGSEFYNKNFKQLMKTYKINLYSSYSNLKASIIERFNRTLKTKMWKQFSMQGSYKWSNILNGLLKEYNATKHRTTGMKPQDVSQNNQYIALQKIRQKVRETGKNDKFKINDKVRISKYKHVFEKGYTPNWTSEIFTIEKKPTSPYTYKLQDYKGDNIAGGFYGEELLKVTNPDIYLVEKVIKKRRNRSYVKWLGFDTSHNSWINSSQLKEKVCKIK